MHFIPSAHELIVRAGEASALVAVEQGNPEVNGFVLAEGESFEVPGGEALVLSCFEAQGVRVNVKGEAKAVVVPRSDFCKRSEEIHDFLEKRRFEPEPVICFVVGDDHQSFAMAELLHNLAKRNMRPCELIDLHGQDQRLALPGLVGRLSENGCSGPLRRRQKLTLGIGNGSVVAREQACLLEGVSDGVVRVPESFSFEGVDATCLVAFDATRSVETTQRVFVVQPRALSTFQLNVEARLFRLHIEHPINVTRSTFLKIVQLTAFKQESGIDDRMLPMGAISQIKGRHRGLVQVRSTIPEGVPFAVLQKKTNQVDDADLEVCALGFFSKALWLHPPGVQLGSVFLFQILSQKGIDCNKILL